MKRLVLLFAGLLIGLTTVSATELHHPKTKDYLNTTKYYRYAQPIMFMERGVEFLIFPDGSFDFNTNAYSDYYKASHYKRNSRRGLVDATYGIRNKRHKYNNPYRYNRGFSISHDRDGKVRRIGNVYLNYDRFGKIKRIGSVYMSYRHGRYMVLNQVGGLQVRYNRWGEIINTRGQVKRHDDYCNFCGVQSCTTEHAFEYRDRHHDDDNYYYYKKNGKVKKQPKRK
ncbi:hypothetical protein [Flavivirga algicola]|uniref:Uncharacterized protein n=1 Tax=Flavivirga algicola TaxID=2729136 RepID=A0ABX1S182_9FLAO|nr:hypothetical protein [Flavivirga algicola]NMH88189.1 hypothetical protein [Flavivirga algicola]